MPWTSWLCCVSRHHWWYRAVLIVGIWLGVGFADEACQMREPRMLAHVEFYNTSLDHVDLKAHFRSWKDNVKEFSVR